MSITNIVKGQGKLTDNEVKDIIRRGDVHFTHIDSTLNQTLQPLVDYVLDLAKRKKDAYILTDFYPRELPTRDGKRRMNYEASYEVDKNGISLVVFDPSSDAMDPGESYIKRVSTQEFLAWAMKDRIYMIDVYQHVQAALGKKKDDGDAQRRNFEQYV